MLRDRFGGVKDDIRLGDVGLPSLFSFGTDRSRSEIWCASSASHLTSLELSIRSRTREHQFRKTNKVVRECLLMILRTIFITAKAYRVLGCLSWCFALSQVVLTFSWFRRPALAEKPDFMKVQQGLRDRAKNCASRDTL
jgi:hypothetical protein